MGVITSKWLDDFYEQRPQLIQPPKTILGYLVGDKIQPAIESLLNIANHTTVEAGTEGRCKCGNKLKKCYSCMRLKVGV